MPAEESQYYHGAICATKEEAFIEEALPENDF